MGSEKKPDQVVFNVEENKYDASLKSYGTDVSAPAIKTTDTTGWKNRNISKANHRIKTKYAELKSEYEKLMNEFEYNNLIFNSKFSFEPIVGKTYHLYKKDDGSHFLSIIAPNQCTFNFTGSFYLDADQIWKKIEENNND